MSTTPIDYEALAKQHGALNSIKGNMDYAALAKQHGAVSSVAPIPQRNPAASNLPGIQIPIPLGLQPNNQSNIAYGSLPAEEQPNIQADLHLNQKPGYLRTIAGNFGLGAETPVQKLERATQAAGGYALTRNPTPENREKIDAIQAERDRLYGRSPTERLAEVPFIGSHVATASKSVQAARQGHGSEAAGYAAATLIPGLGPTAASVGEKIGEKDYAGAAGDLTTIGIMGAQGKLASNIKAPRTDNLIPRTVKGYLGVNPQQAGRAITKALGEHAEAVGKVQESNLTAQAKHEVTTAKVNQRQAALNAETKASNKATATEHAETTERINQINEAGQQAVGRKAELSKQITNGSTYAGKLIRDLEGRVRAVGSSKYASVEKATEGAAIPASNLAPVVRHAQENILSGSPESIKQFSDLLRKGEAEPVETSAGTAIPGTPLHDILVKQGAIQPIEQLGFRDLQGYYTELGQKMQGGNVPGDVYRALKYVRQQVGNEMQKMADSRGAGDTLKDAQQYWRQYEQTFHDMRPVSQGGSPIARSFRAVDPAHIAAPLLGKASARAIQMLNNYSPDTGGIASRLAQNYNEMHGLPKSFKPKELPQAPTPKVAKQLEMPQAPQPKPIPEAPNLERVITESREQRLQSLSSGLRRPSSWDLSIIGALYRHGLGVWLENPRVVNWLAKPRAADFDHISKMPGRIPSEVREAVANVYTKQAQSGRLTSLPSSVRSFLNPIQVHEIEQLAPQIKTTTSATPSVTSRVSNTDRSSAVAAVMGALKRGDITQQEADSKIQRLRGGGSGKLIRMPQEP